MVPFAPGANRMYVVCSSPFSPHFLLPVLAGVVTSFRLGVGSVVPLSLTVPVAVVGSVRRLRVGGLGFYDLGNCFVLGFQGLCGVFFSGRTLVRLREGVVVILISLIYIRLWFCAVKVLPEG